MCTIKYILICGQSSPYIGKWAEPPILGPSNQTVDGPLMDDGDIGSFIGAIAGLWRIYNLYYERNGQIDGQMVGLTFSGLYQS